jgi:flagellar protein FliS
MSAKALNTYRNLAVQTAVSESTPLELILMVYRRLIDNLRQAQMAMQEGRDDSEYIGKSIDLIQKGLAAALDQEKGGEIAQNLSQLYDWAIREMLRARLKRDPDLLTGVIEVIKNLQSAWIEINSLRAGAAGAGSSASVKISAAATMPTA